MVHLLGNEHWNYRRKWTKKREGIRIAKIGHEGNPAYANGAADDVSGVAATGRMKCTQ